MSVGQSGVSLENLCPPRHKPLHQQKKKKCFPSLSMSVGQCGVTLENHCPPRQESVHRQKKKNCFSTFSMYVGQCGIYFPFSFEEEILFYFFYVFRIVWKQLSYNKWTNSSYSSRRRRKILLLPPFKTQCVVYLENLCPPRHEPLHQQKKKKCFPSFSMSAGQCVVSLENHCQPRHKPLHQ